MNFNEWPIAVSSFRVMFLCSKKTWSMSNGIFCVFSHLRLVFRRERTAKELLNNRWKKATREILMLVFCSVESIRGVEETVNVVKGIGGTAYGYKCDLADKEDVYRVAKKTREDVGEVTILINNAGVASGTLLMNTPDHLIKRTFDVNIIAHFWTVKAFLPKMIEKNHGHIVTVASMAGHVGISKLVDYCASKHAAVGFDEALRVELEAQGIKGIKTTCICPYFIQSTGMFGSVTSRFLPRLKSNEVADRIIEGIRRDETSVMIPGIFHLGIVFKRMMPWSVNSMFLRGLVPDACNRPIPRTETVQTVTSDGVVENGKLPVKNRLGSLSDSLSQMNHRIATNTGKNL